MKTHRTRIREHLRSARVSALTAEERRQEMRAAEARLAAPREGDAQTSATSGAVLDAEGRGAPSPAGGGVTS